MDECLVAVLGANSPAPVETAHVVFDASAHGIPFSGTPAQGFDGAVPVTVRSDEHADSRLDVRKPAVGCRRLVSDATKVVTDAPERVVRILVGIPDHADGSNISGFGFVLKRFF